MSKQPIDPKNEKIIKRGVMDHLKSGTDNVVKAKENLFWQKSRGLSPVETVKGNIKQLVAKPPPQSNAKGRGGEKVKMVVTGALNLVPGIGSVTNMAVGVKKSVDEKKKAIKEEFNKGNVVIKTPLKSKVAPTPNNPKPITVARTRSNASVKLTPPKKN